MAVEDELRVGAIPDIKPRILTDQVCACVYIFYHPYLLNQSCPKTACIILTSHSTHSPKPVQEKGFQLSYTSAIAILPKYVCHIGGKKNISPLMLHGKYSAHPKNPMLYVQRLI